MTLRDSFRRLDDELRGVPMQRYRLFQGILGVAFCVVGVMALWRGFWPAWAAIVIASLGAVGATGLLWNFVAQARRGT